jgi:hypothetical protein
MLNLEEFYYQVVNPTPPQDRYQTIQLIEDVIVVNFDCLYDRECSIRGTDQLIYLAHRLGQGKRFLFLSEDGANIGQSGAVQIINNIVNCFNLSAETCAVICRESINIPNVTVVNNEAVPYWCRVIYPTIKSIPIPQGPFTKKFAAWYHRGTFFRLQLAQHLLEKYPDDSFISYQEHGIIVDRNLKEYLEGECRWAEDRTPIIYDQVFPNRIFDFELIAGAKRKPYADYFIEIVAETDILTTNWITEKTVKNLYIGKPFIMMGAVGSLAKIRSFGFLTFSPWINETYDTIENIHLRLTAVKGEIDRLATKSLSELHEMQRQIMPILIHNRETYGKYINSR